MVHLICPCDSFFCRPMHNIGQLDKKNDQNKWCTLFVHATRSSAVLCTISTSLIKNNQNKWCTLFVHATRSSADLCTILASLIKKMTRIHGVNNESWGFFDSVTYA